MSSVDRLRLLDGRDFNTSVICRIIALVAIVLMLYSFHQNSSLKDRIESQDSRLKKVEEKTGIANYHNEFNNKHQLME